LKNLASTIEESKDSIAALASDIQNTQDKIVALDQSVAEATEQRKAEAAEYAEFKKLQGVAKALLEKAINKLNKFYNPDLYVAPTAAPLSREDQIFQAAGGQLATTPEPKLTDALNFIQVQDKPEAPGTWGGDYKAKGQGSNAVMTLLNSLIADITKQVQQADHDEKTAVRDYEGMMETAKESRATDVKTVGDRQGAKAGVEGTLEEAQSAHGLTSQAVAELNNYIADLHKSCDFILENFEMRREARTSEIEGLKSAKGVLSGADYS
jgi:hypothetical protein